MDRVSKLPPKRRYIWWPKFQEKSGRLTRYGNIQGNPHNRELGKDDSLSPSTPPESARPHDGEDNHTQITIPFDPIQVADLQENFGHKPGDTEIQQLESYQCRYNNGPSIQIPVDSHQQLIANTIETLQDNISLALGCIQASCG